MEEIKEEFFSFPYHRGTITVSVPGEKVAAVLTPKGLTEGDGEQRDLVKEALDNPIGSASLSRLAEGKRKVVVITSDHTRAVPSSITMPLLLKEIRSGNSEAEVTILIATGLHRETSSDELLDRFGREIFQRERIVVHNVEREDDMVFIGDLPSGKGCSLNRLAVEADLLVTEGFIEPHFFAGFSGGRKSVLPGVASRETVNANHSASAIAHPLSKTGVLEGNPIHEDMLAAARLAGVDFILNVVLDEEKRIVGAFAGDLDEAHRSGCAMVSSVAGVEKVVSDIVITSNGGYPLDQNLYQAPKAISTAAECVRPGGAIVIAAACHDGFGGANFEKLMRIGDPRRIEEYLLSLSDEDTIPEQWSAQILSKVMSKATVILVSELDPGDVRSVGLVPASDMAEGLSLAEGIVGKNASITVIPDGVAVIVEGGMDR